MPPRGAKRKGFPRILQLLLLCSSEGDGWLKFRPFTANHGFDGGSGAIF